MRGRNVIKPFTIAGFILGEIYMLYTVLAPVKASISADMFASLIPGFVILAPASVGTPAQIAALLAGMAILMSTGASTPVPASYMVWRIGAAALFFGPFGAAIGAGVGMLVSAILPKR